MSIGDSVYRNISSVVDNNAVRRVRTVNTHVYWIAADDLSTRANRYSRERERESSPANSSRRVWKDSNNRIGGHELGYSGGIFLKY